MFCLSSKVSTLSVAKPEKAKMVENLLIQNARMGLIRGKVYKLYINCYCFNQLII
jgi:DNA-binding TFAR19-related protein (PDSD5 family)